MPDLDSSTTETTTGHRVVQEVPRHEKIRFRRDEITDLGAMPSAAGQELVRERPSLRRRAGHCVLAAVAVLGSLVLLVIIAIEALSYSGVGQDRMRAEAERAIEGLAGVDVDVSMGQVRLALDGLRLIAVEVPHVRLKRADGKAMAEAGMMRFGIRLLPLLSGDVRLGGAKISEARIVVDAMPEGGGTDWSAVLRNPDGLIDPQKLLNETFRGVHRGFEAVQYDAMREIALANVDFVLPSGGEVNVVRVVDASLAKTRTGELRIGANFDVDGRGVALSASAARAAGTDRIAVLDATVSMSDPYAGKTDIPAAKASRIGSADLVITGREGTNGEGSELIAKGSIGQSTLDLEQRGQLVGDIAIDLRLADGLEKLDIRRLLVTTGRSTFDFSGGLGPRPATGVAGDNPAYRFELMSRESRLAPGESPEPALTFLARVAGTYDIVTRTLAAEQIGVKSGPGGEALGKASVQFAEGKAPGIFLAFNVHDMSVAHVKQLWPWFSARNARLWVLQNLFGGRVVDGNVQFDVKPDRLGNGVPLTAQEVFGRFEIDGARFDTAGLIPPIRDARGIVEFHGNDVDVALSSGTVFMPSGRTVAASNGKLKVAKANVMPVIGALDIDVTGSADAVAELASYEPINAMRHVGILPEELTGDVIGNVKADIPLTRGIDTDTLDWTVALNYDGLSVAKPLDGQKLSDAKGTITVTPDKAVIAANGKLNGVPAELNLVEPLRDKDIAKERNVQFVLDDKARNALVPGLSDMLSGTIKVDVEQLEQGRRNIDADLTAARLDLPWVGWSKGPGIPAKVSFTMDVDGERSTLSDFRLTGKTFNISGDVSLAKGSLTSARFGQVQLNRGDDVDVNIKRSGKGFAVQVKGNSLDARALIKQFMSDVDTATKSAGTGAVSVTANVGTLVGFSGEKLSNVTLEYSGLGSKVGGLKVNATANSGGLITVSNVLQGEGRRLDVRSADAGAILRFLDVYPRMQGGSLALALESAGDGPLKGQVDVREFWVVDEPRLASIVSSKPVGDNRSLNQAVRKDIDTSRVKFERGFAQIDKREKYLALENGVLRGPLIGTTFQGVLYDQQGQMNMTGTFMPAYGLNRLFGELPLVGVILGNGRDRGLIGVTYKLSGDANAPKLHVNPLSVIAPGIFRAIFEY
ncbi:Large exoproteins involved in heme utilization or adhesion [Aminobacter niigataensis]|nr:DUF3971 domain-containing protein [Aminobacter niigataensis]CAI2935169.1 Large exoproteins involved in heme utilization or adhesion [Aminobacter niigataensis]